MGFLHLVGVSFPAVAAFTDKDLFRRVQFACASAAHEQLGLVLSPTFFWLAHFDKLGSSLTERSQALNVQLLFNIIKYASAERALRPACNLPMHKSPGRIDNKSGYINVWKIAATLH